MNSLTRALSVTALIGLLTGVLVAGAGNRTGTGGANQLLIPVGARNLAMGGASISTASGIDALFWNPAGVARVSGSAEVMFSHMEYIADIGVEYGAAAGTFGDIGTFALSIKSMSIGEIAVTTTENPDGTGQTYTPQFFTAGLTYARNLSDRVSVGLTAMFVSEDIGDANASGVAFDAGVTYNNLANVNGLSIGIAIKNVGPQMQYDGAAFYQVGEVPGQNRPPGFVTLETAPFEMPASIELGVGYMAAMSEDADLLVSGTFESNNFSEDEYKLGAEAAINDMFFLRGGMSFAPETPDNSEYIYGFTAGAGLNYDMGDTSFGIDYAFQDVEFFSGNHIIAVQIGF